MADVCDPVIDVGHGLESLSHRLWVRFAGVGHGVEATATRLSVFAGESGAGLDATVDAIATHVVGIGVGQSDTADALAAATRMRAVGHGADLPRSRAHESEASAGNGVESLTHRVRMATTAHGHGDTVLQQAGASVDHITQRGQGRESTAHRRAMAMLAIGNGLETLAQALSARALAVGVGAGGESWAETVHASTAVFGAGTGLSAWQDRLTAQQSAIAIGYGLGWAVDAEMGGHAWTASTDTWGMSEWRDLPWLTGIAWDGALLGVADDGLYLLDADDDAGADISAWVETGLSDFGSPLLKRASNAYVGLTADGPLGLDVWVTSADGETTCSYVIDQPGSAAAPAKIHLGKGLLSRYWRFLMNNQAGAGFTVHDFRVLFDETQRRA